MKVIKSDIFTATITFKYFMAQSTVGFIIPDIFQKRKNVDDVNGKCCQGFNIKDELCEVNVSSKNHETHICLAHKVIVVSSLVSMPVSG